LPVITGIGHERDDTVVDMVAHTRLKTPTAVASFLIECMVREAAQLRELEQTICDAVNACILREKTVLQTLTARFPVTVIGHIERHRKQLHAMTAFMSSLPQWIRHRVEKLDELPPRLQRAANTMLLRHTTWVSEMPELLQRAYKTTYSKCQQTLELNEQYIKMVSPEYILKRGYTLTYKNGRIVKVAAGLTVNDEVTIKFSDGEKMGLIS
jgi:exodeoxyribonuclease VII large subunit